MKRSDLRYYTQDQIEFKDENALRVAKASIALYLDSIDWYTFNPKYVPKPRIISKEYFEKAFLRYDQRYEKGEIKEKYSWDDIAELIYFVDAIMPTDYLNSLFGGVLFEGEIKELLQPISDYMYYMACNGYQLVDMPTLTKDYYSELASTRSTNNYEHVVDQLRYTDLILTKFSRVCMVEESDFPKDLLEHLKKFNTLEDQVKEVCRLQMLGPKYRRADDALGSLLNAWENISKYEKGK